MLSNMKIKITNNYFIIIYNGENFQSKPDLSSPIFFRDYRIFFIKQEMQILTKGLMFDIYAVIPKPICFK